MSLHFPLHPDCPRVPAQQLEAALLDPGFGRHFTDHMANARWTPDQGWHQDMVGPRVPYQLDPAAAVLHYAQEIFEGLKAYRHQDGGVWLFRPDLNARRFVDSATRLALPTLPEEDFLASVTALVRADEPWVPQPDSEKSLYLRPFMFAAEAFLGVRPAQDIAYGVIAGPAGAYFRDGVRGVVLWVSDQFTRAAPGGTGAAKCGGNYASGLAAQLEAQQHDCDQVLYVDGAERAWLEESGTMNVMVVTSDGRLVTPGLGTILPGVTRQSVLELAGEHGLSAQQRRIGLQELYDGIADGSVREVFACGTAAVITPICGLRSADRPELTIADGSPGRVTMAMREHLLDIQYGRLPDRHGWLHRVC